MLQNPHHYPWCHAPSLVRDCPAGATPPRTAASPPPNGGNYTIRGATRRRHAEGRLLMLQNPHHYPRCHAPALVQDCPAGATPPRGATSPTVNRGSCATRGPVRVLLADECAIKWGNCTIRGATRRRHADGRLLMLQNPHLYPWRHAPSRVQWSLTGAGLPGGRQ